MKPLRTFAGLIALLLFAFAAAQGNTQVDAPDLSAVELDHGTATGVMTGTVDGEAFTVYSIVGEAGLEEPTNSAQWQDWRGIGLQIQVDVSFHGSSFFDWNGAFALEFHLGDDLQLVQADDVPDVTYFQSLTRGYRMNSGTLELTEVAWVDDETISVSGTFEGTFTSPLTDEVREITAEFTIERVTFE